MSNNHNILLKYIKFLPSKSISFRLIHSLILNELKSKLSMFLIINFCVDNLTTSANSGNIVNCMFEHSKMFSKQIHPNSQILCEAIIKNKDVKSKTTNMMNHIEYTNMVTLKIKCSFYNHSKQMLYIFISITKKKFFFFSDRSQHHHVCTSDGRLVFPIHQLELLVERILDDINEFHLTFINEVSVVFIL